MSPAEIQKAASEAGLPDTIDLPTCDVVDEKHRYCQVSPRVAFAQYMRIHALGRPGGLSMQMGRIPVVCEPRRSAGTSDETAAAKDERAADLERCADLWVTETALATALNVSYMAEQLSIFSIVIGDRPRAYGASDS